MIIKSLEIYGYGQFVQRKIEFNKNFTEIFGENEAGKSTIQAFIHSILFGFPTKKSKEPRLEPRLGNQYGGKLVLILDDGLEIEVERIKGSAQGDVKVYLLMVLCVMMLGYKRNLIIFLKRHIKVSFHLMY